MKAIAITLLALLLPLHTQAQPVELTLICQGEAAFNLVKNRNLPLPWSGSFTAIVRMQTDGRATVDVNGDAGDCKRFVGPFNELKVLVGCIKPDIPSTLDIDRIDGAFSLVLPGGVVEYDGHCKPAKKLF
jgi:hypothetical protein